MLPNNGWYVEDISSYDAKLNDVNDNEKAKVCEYVGVQNNADDKSKQYWTPTYISSMCKDGSFFI